MSKDNTNTILIIAVIGAGAYFLSKSNFFKSSGDLITGAGDAITSTGKLVSSTEDVITNVIKKITTTEDIVTNFITKNKEDITAAITPIPSLISAASTNKNLKKDVFTVVMPIPALIYDLVTPNKTSSIKTSIDNCGNKIVTAAAISPTKAKASLDWRTTGLSTKQIKSGIRNEIR